MQNQPRGHHFYSHCYLKGFTETGKRDSKFTVLKLSDKKILKNQDPQNFGKKRDFNKVDIDGIDPYELERGLSKFESDLSNSIQNVEKTHKFEGEDRANILNMLALFTIRNIHQRDHWDSLYHHLGKIMVSAAASAKIGEKVNDLEITAKTKVELEKFANALNNESYEITATRTSHIKREFEGIDHILPYLFGRKWTLVIAPTHLNFITSDHPVILMWKDTQIYTTENPISPGFGLINTQIFFPLSKGLALIGDFNGDDATVMGDERLVALINSNVLFFAKEQIYTPQSNFCFIRPNGEIAKFQEDHWE